jgi:hypothetical protein
MWPPRLPEGIRAFAMLDGAIVWRLDCEDGAVFADRVAAVARASVIWSLEDETDASFSARVSEIAKVCGCGGEVTLWRARP